jgi:hypothetical protein
LKAKLNRHFRKNRLSRIIEDYVLAAQKEWEGLDWEMINYKILDSMERRVASAVQWGGERKKY